MHYKIQQVVKLNKYIHSNDTSELCVKGACNLGYKNLLKILNLVYWDGYCFS